MRPNSETTDIFGASLAMSVSAAATAKTRLDRMRSALAAVLILLVAPAAATADTWAPTGSMTSPRSVHTATRLANGKVLVATGYNLGVVLKTAELYDPATGTWSGTGNLATGRLGATAKLLPNGKVLVAGGSTILLLPTYYASAEIYDPATGTWSPTGSMDAARRFHTATRLLTGRVLVAGGRNSSSCTLTSTILYNQATGAWTSTGAMSTGRCGATATLLGNGKVLMAGGAAAATAELYNPATGAWSATGPMISVRSYAAAALLSDGRVLVAGGTDGTSTVASAEVYDPVTNTWSSVGDMGFPRQDANATLLTTGQVLVDGGRNLGSPEVRYASSELYDPVTASWSPAGSMSSVRASHTTTTLADGQLLAAGGSIDGTYQTSSADLYGSFPSPTATPTPTATATSSLTSTPTVAPTSTETQTLSDTPTPASTATATSSATPTPTAAPTSTVTQTLSDTPTPAPTATATATLTVMASDTPAVTSTPEVTATPGFTCASTPVGGCRLPGRSALTFAEKAVGAGSLVWQWARGAQTDRVDFGNPLHTTAYALCMYEQTSATANLAMTIVVTPGRTCVKGPCWKETATGFVYKDSSESADGIKQIVLRRGVDRKAKILIRGAGPDLPLPAPATATQFLHADADVLVQLVNSESDICWEARYPAPAAKNSTIQFKDRIP